MNFSPKLLNSNNLISKIKYNKVYCKNFIFTILALDLLNSSLKFKKFKIHIIKKRKHVGSILRAPYKCKSAQFSLGLYRYYLSLTFNIDMLVRPNINNCIDFNNFNKKIIQSYNYFESALVTQVSRSITIPSNITII
jgi:hypothetical protein